MMTRSLDCGDVGDGFDVFDTGAFIPWIVVLIIIWGWLSIQFVLCMICWYNQLSRENRIYTIDFTTKTRDPAVFIIGVACICRFVYFIVLVSDAVQLGNGSCPTFGAAVVADRADKDIPISDDDLKSTGFGYAKGPFVYQLFYPIMLAGYALVFAHWYHQTVEIARANKHTQALRKKAVSEHTAGPGRGPKMLVDSNAFSYDSLQLFVSMQCSLTIGCFFFLASSSARPGSHVTLITACAIMVAIGITLNCLFFFFFGRVLSGSQEAFLTNLQSRYNRIEYSNLTWLLVAIFQFVAQSSLNAGGTYAIFFVSCILELVASLNMIASLYSREDVARIIQKRPSKTERKTDDVEAGMTSESNANNSAAPQPKTWWMVFEPLALLKACAAVDQYVEAYHARAAAKGARPPSPSAKGPATAEHPVAPAGWISLHQITGVDEEADDQTQEPVPLRDKRASSRLSVRFRLKSDSQGSVTSTAERFQNFSIDQVHTQTATIEVPSHHPSLSVGNVSYSSQRTSEPLRQSRKSFFDRFSAWRHDRASGQGSDSTSTTRPVDDMLRQQAVIAELSEAMVTFGKFGVQKTPQVNGPTTRFSKRQITTAFAIKPKMLKAVLIECGYWPTRHEIEEITKLSTNNDCGMILFEDLMRFWMSYPGTSGYSLVDEVLRVRKKACRIYLENLCKFAAEQDELVREKVDPDQQICATKSIRPSVQISRLVVDGVLPPQVFSTVYDQLAEVLTQENFVLPPQPVVLREIDRNQTGNIQFQDYIRYVNSIIQESSTPRQSDNTNMSMSRISTERPDRQRASDRYESS